MATSGSSDFNLTAAEIVQAAHRKLGVLAFGQSLTSPQLQNGLQALNAMIKAWKGLGIQLFNLEWITLPLHESSVGNGSDGNDYECIRNLTTTADEIPITGDKYKSFWKQLTTTAAPAITVGTDYISIGHYFLDSKVVGIEQARRVENNGTGGVTFFDLMPIAKSDYFNLAGALTAGKTTEYFFYKQPVPELFLYPVPENITDYVLELCVMTYPEDFDSVDNNPDFLQEWLEALIFNLATKLASEFNVGGQKLLEIQQQAAFSLDLARRLDEETGPLQVGPDLRLC